MRWSSSSPQRNFLEDVDLLTVSPIVTNYSTSGGWLHETDLARFSHVARDFCPGVERYQCPLAVGHDVDGIEIMGSTSGGWLHETDLARPII
jgi:hypothetical protein